MEFFLIIWLLFGAASAIVMGSKGRSGCGGFLLGFLFGPLGLVIALVLRADTEAMEREALSGLKGRKCPYCAEMIKAEAIKCRHCGSSVQPLE